MWSRFPKRTFFVGAAGVLVVGLVVWKLFFSNSFTDAQLLTVHKQVYEQRVSISGDVVAAETSDLGFAQGGRIAHIYALVGERVKAGQRIAEIENGELHALVLQKQAALQSAQANLSQLQEGTRPEEIAVTEAQIMSDQSALLQANQGVVNAIQNAYTVSDDAVHNKLDQLFINPTASNIDVIFTSTQSQLTTTMKSGRGSLEGVLQRWQTQTAAVSATQDLTSAQAAAQANLAAVMQVLADANTALNTAIPSGSITAATIGAFIVTIATARANVNSALSTLTSAVASAKANAAQLAKDQKTLVLQKSGSTVQSIAQAQAQVTAAQADVAAAQAQLTKTEVVAPFDGVLVRMDVKRGEIVSPNTSEISIQGDGVFEIETYVPEVNIAAVRVGDFASTTLDAYGPTVSFDAQVIRIDPAKTDRDGVATYKTTLAFLRSDERIRSGMTASVTIQTAVIPQVYVIPSGAVFIQDGVHKVQVLEGKSIITRTVTISDTSLGNVPVLSGLTDNEQVILNPRY